MTTTFTAPAACAGVVAVRVVPLTTLAPVAAAPPKLTVAPDTKLVPVRVTTVPPPDEPLPGATMAMLGGGRVKA